jgi:hypothetical protein
VHLSNAPIPRFVMMGSGVRIPLAHQNLGYFLSGHFPVVSVSVSVFPIGFWRRGTIGPSIASLQISTSIRANRRTLIVVSCTRHGANADDARRRCA